MAIHGTSLGPIVRSFDKTLSRPELSTTQFVGALLRFQGAIVSDLESGSDDQFGLAWTLHAIATDLLRYSIEDDYVHIDPKLLHEAATALRGLATQRTIDWPRLSQALTVLKQLAKMPPLRAQMVEVQPNLDGSVYRFLAMLAPNNAPEITVSSQSRVLVPILEQSISRPEYARPLIDAFARQLEALRARTDFTALCFVEKTAGPVGALSLHAALVDALGVPACIYRDNYWVGRAKLAGFQPIEGTRVAIVYDLCVTGDGLRHVAAGLKRLGCHTVGAMVLAGFERQDTIRIDQHDVSIEALLWLDDIQDEILEARRTGKDTRHLTFLSGDRSGSDAPVTRQEFQTPSPRQSSGGITMGSSDIPCWQSNLFAYDKLSALAFETRDDFLEALERIFHGEDLRGLPADVVGNRTLIVPAASVPYFKDLRFVVQDVGSMDDLTDEELTELRQQQGHH